jgi:hyperosmotically inducible protein
MIRTLFKVVLVVILVAAAAAFFVGYRFAGNGVESPISAEPAVPSVDTQKARETGAKVGEAVATGAVQAQQVLNEGSLTAKIKSKMALDDTVKALSIDVDTNGTEVTLSGSVNSAAERDKAIQLARETAGVTAVHNKLVIR